VDAPSDEPREAITTPPAASRPSARGLDVAVVGGGMAGLVAARDLAAAGATVQLFEAGERLGGQVRTVAVAGRPVDVGAEALHLSAPGLADLVAELSLEDEVVAPTSGPTWIWTARGLRRLPAGTGPAGPTRMAPVVGARILSPVGLARAAAEPLVPAVDVSDDVSVGDFLTRRFGQQVTDRLVDPLLGSLHGGDVSRLSLQAATPQLAAAAAQRRSLVLRTRRRGHRGPPPMATLRSGLAGLVEALTPGPETTIRLGTAVRRVVPTGGRYRVDGDGRTLATVDAVIVATPPHTASPLLEAVSRTAAGRLAAVRTATVATVVVAYPRTVVDEVPALRGTGLLVPSSADRLLKAATFLGTKWPHLAHPDRFLVRLSAGRAGADRVSELDDGALVAALHDDLAAATGLRAEPVETHVQRWPRALPQLEVGHAAHLAAIRRSLTRHPQVVLAGAAYGGLGVAACVGSGRRAADRLLAPGRGRRSVPVEGPS
jgi:protoporphyrinogen/coproporphyrinogen III oxidase